MSPSTCCDTADDLRVVSVVVPMLPLMAYVGSLSLCTDMVLRESGTDSRLTLQNNVFV